MGSPFRDDFLKACSLSILLLVTKIVIIVNDRAPKLQTMGSSSGSLKRGAISCGDNFTQ